MQGWPDGGIGMSKRSMSWWVNQNICPTLPGKMGEVQKDSRRFSDCVTHIWRHVVCRGDDSTDSSSVTHDSIMLPVGDATVIHGPAEAVPVPEGLYTWARACSSACPARAPSPWTPRGASGGSSPTRRCGWRVVPELDSLVGLSATTRFLRSWANSGCRSGSTFGEWGAIHRRGTGQHGVRHVLHLPACQGTRANHQWACSIHRHPVDDVGAHTFCRPVSSS
jgi:hypothetical protein